MPGQSAQKHLLLRVPPPSQDLQTWARQLVQFLQLKLDQLDRQTDFLIMDSGSPEGTVQAKVGTVYLRLDGGAGTTFYVKESGDNTRTGWVGK